MLKCFLILKYPGSRAGDFSGCFLFKYSHDETCNHKFYCWFHRFCRFAVFGGYRLYYEVHFAARHRRIWPRISRRPRACRRNQISLVDDPARMGIYPFLPGSGICHLDGGAYHSALDLDKKLFQIAIWIWHFAKNDQPLTQRFLRRLTKLTIGIFQKWGEIGVFQLLLVHFGADAGSWVENRGCCVNLRSIGKAGKKNTSKNWRKMRQNEQKFIKTHAFWV